MRGAHIAVRVLSAAAGGTALAAALAARRVLSRHEAGPEGRERRLRATFEIRLETGRPPEAARCPTCGRTLEPSGAQDGARPHECPGERGATAMHAPAPQDASAPGDAGTAEHGGATDPSAIPSIGTAGPPPATSAPLARAAGLPASPRDEPAGHETVGSAEAGPAIEPVPALELPVAAPGEHAGEQGAIRVDTGSDPVLGRLMESAEAPVEPPAPPTAWRPSEPIETWDTATHAAGPAGARPGAEHAPRPPASADGIAPNSPHADEGPSGGEAPRAPGAATPERAVAAAPATPGGAPWPGAHTVPPAVAAIPPTGVGPDGRAEDVCAEAAAVVADSCDALDRARDAHAVALERYGPIRRSHADVEHRVAEALRSLDARRVADEKAAAQQRFRQARTSAASPAEVQAAAGEWLRTVDALNRGIQQASRVLPALREQEQRLAAELAVATTQLDVTRIALEAADERCRDAREALAACEEARAAFESSPLARRTEHPELDSTEEPAAVAAVRELAAGAAPSGGDRVEAARAGWAGDVPVAEVPDRPRATTSTPGGLGRRSSPGGLRPAGEPSEIVRLLRGEQAALDRVAAALSGGSASEAHRWQLELAALADAITEAALDAAAIDPAGDHAFWAGFSALERREIVAVLASNGFRFDGRQGFVDGRAPTQRDLSLAVGYVGIDPQRVRAWPSDEEAAALLRGARVAAAEFLRVRAPDLSLGHMAAMLGPRADDLTQLWNAWGRVRPLLLSVSG